MLSILLAYRARKKELSLFLQAMDLALVNHACDVELIIVGQHDAPAEAPVAPEKQTGVHRFKPQPRILKHDYFDGLQFVESVTQNIGTGRKCSIKFEWFESTGLFHKTRALNQTFNLSSGDYVTILDVDCLMPASFLTDIEQFYSDPENENVKLSHRVQFMDKSQTGFINGGVDPNNRLSPRSITRLQYIVERGLKFPLSETHYAGTLIGCSQFTLRRGLFEQVGGFDETFVGWGPEDTELNLRIAKAQIVTKMNDVSYLYHMFHDRLPDWLSREIETKNREYFVKRTALGYPKPEKGLQVLA